MMNPSGVIALNLGLAVLCYGKRLLSASGSLSGLVIGSAIGIFLGWQGWLILLAFFFGGTAATFFRKGKKETRGLAQADHGRRRWNHAWANAGCGVICAGISAWFLWHGGAEEAEAWRWAFVACFAAALSDTLSSEFGQLADQEPRLITNFQIVPHGTDGGITRAGMLMGIFGAALLTLLGRFLRLVPVRATLPVLMAGVSGNLLDSLLGATLQRRGLMNNDTVNFSNTLGGAALGYFGFWMMKALPGWLADLGLGHVALLNLFI
jgi:uncharacterized protein (TIGR00297 family)